MSVQIQIDLQGGELLEGGIRRYRPGESVEGNVTIFPDRDLKSRRVVVKLRWHTEGRGDRDAEDVAVQELHQGPLPAHLPFSSSFVFTAPQEPWSYRGTYVNIVWEVVVEVDLALRRNPKKSQVFVLDPDR